MKHRHLGHRKWRWMRVTQIMARDGTNCTICGRPLSRAIRDPELADYITFDHIVPTSRGGLSMVSNLRLAHRLCNMERGNEPLVEDSHEA